jgi:hypothetical protein
MRTQSAIAHAKFLKVDTAKAGDGWISSRSQRSRGTTRPSTASDRRCDSRCERGQLADIFIENTSFLEKPFPRCGHARKIRDVLKPALEAGSAAEN